ncbi:MAG: hypothetical protein ACREO9_05970, partial [Lysobacterales bacterium]
MQLLLLAGVWKRHGIGKGSLDPGYRQLEFILVVPNGISEPLNPADRFRLFFQVGFRKIVITSRFRLMLNGLSTGNKRRPEVEHHG